MERDKIESHLKALSNEFLLVLTIFIDGSLRNIGIIHLLAPHSGALAVQCFSDPIPYTCRALCVPIKSYECYMCSKSSKCHNCYQISQFLQNFTILHVSYQCARIQNALAFAPKTRRSALRPTFRPGCAAYTRPSSISCVLDIFCIYVFYLYLCVLCVLFGC